MEHFHLAKNGVNVSFMRPTLTLLKFCLNLFIRFFRNFTLMAGLKADVLDFEVKFVMLKLQMGHF